MRVEEPWMLRHEAISGKQKVLGGGLGEVSSSKSRMADCGV